MKFRIVCSFTLFLFCVIPALAQSDTTPATAQSASPAQSPSATPNQSSVTSEVREQQPAPSVTIRQTVRRVIVDVTVLDHNGKPVRGLKASDFSVTEDKQPQRVLSFDAYDFNKPSISRGANAPPLPPNMFLNIPAVPERGPLYVMLLDLLNTETEDQMTERQQLLKFIDSKPDGTRFAVFSATDKLHLVQGFTSDKDVLHAALDGRHPHPNLPRIFLYGANYGRGNPYAALDMLTRIGQYLDGIPGRKNLIWMAGQFEIDLFPREGDPTDVQAAIRTEINELAQAQVAVYPVNVRGVVVNPEGALTGGRPHGGAANDSDPNPGGGPSSTANDPTLNPVLQGMQTAGKGTSLNRNYATQDAIASMTGGRAFYSDNGIAEVLSEATEQGGTYYTLTYAPPTESNDGKCHNIGVKLADTGYTISYRRNYCDSAVVEAPQDETADQSVSHTPLVFPLQAGDLLQGNIRPGAPMLHDLIFSAHFRVEGPAVLASPQQMEQLLQQADYYRTRKRNKADKPARPVKIQNYVVEYRVLDPQMKIEIARGRQPVLEFAVAAFDVDGKVLNGVINDAAPDNSGQPSDNKSGVYRAHQSLVVPLNAVSIRAGVRDRLTDRMGTLEVALPLKREPVAQTTNPH